MRERHANTLIYKVHDGCQWVPRARLQAKGKTSDAITALCQLAPPTALLVEVDDKGAVVREEEVATALVHRGDLLKVSHL